MLQRKYKQTSKRKEKYKKYSCRYEEKKVKSFRKTKKKTLKKGATNNEHADTQDMNQRETNH